MSMNVVFAVEFAAVLVMFYALYMAVSLKGEMQGGVIGRNWTFLVSLVGLFAAGYVAMPFLGRLSSEVLQLVVAVIFLFGAVYVVVTINLIRRIIRILSE